MAFAQLNHPHGRTAHELAVFASEAEASHAGAASFVEQAGIATKERGRFMVALSGGDTPRPIYELLARDPFVSMVPLGAGPPLLG